MDWSNQTISPKHTKAQEVNVRYPCPGLCRFVGTVSFLIVGLGIYYGAQALLGLHRLDMAAPAWTTKHVGLIGASMVFACLAGLLGFAYSMTIEVRSERLNELFIVLWQFLAIGNMAWLMTIGTAMSISLGREEAKAAVLHFGAERATLHVVAMGSVVGLLLGAAFFLARRIRLTLAAYFVFSVVIAGAAARWHFSTYGIAGKAWILAGVVTPILILYFTPSMIARDHRQRRIVMEQSGTRGHRP
jgi:hypothetical protein